MSSGPMARLCEDPKHGAPPWAGAAWVGLPAGTQAALVLARTQRLDRARLERAFEATHTNSPAGAITASVDAARALLARDGKQLCGRLLRLVAGGLTDLQIADKLILSPRTVHAHISSIYSKLGVTSRSAATRYAIEHHLA